MIRIPEYLERGADRDGPPERAGHSSGRPRAGAAGDVTGGPDR